MNTINSSYINALLADAAYVDLVSGPIDEGENKAVNKGDGGH